MEHMLPFPSGYPFILKLCYWIFFMNKSCHLFILDAYSSPLCWPRRGITRPEF